MPRAAVSVEEVDGRKVLARFVELPQALHGSDPRWAPPVMAWERYRLDARRNPYFERGDGTYLLARRLGQVAGRIVAHLPHPGGEGRFGFFTCVDDEDVAAALVEAARAWLAAQGCASMTGPWSFEPGDEPGAQVDGFASPGTTGRPWHPPEEAALLRAQGFEVVAEQRWWRLPATGEAPVRPPAGDPPGHAGPYADRRLVLGGVAAVPDVSEALRASSLRGAWALARRARTGDWTTCTVVRCDVPPDVGVSAVQVAAGVAGYRHVVAPWSPDPGAPAEAVHATLRLTW